MFLNKREKCQIELEVNHQDEDLLHLEDVIPQPDDVDLQDGHLKDVNLQKGNHQNVGNRRVVILLLDVFHLVDAIPQLGVDLQEGLQDADFY
jgi:hypothetical protein